MHYTLQIQCFKGLHHNIITPLCSEHCYSVVHHIALYCNVIWYVILHTEYNIVRLHCTPVHFTVRH